MYVTRIIDDSVLGRPFARMGARVRFEELRPSRLDREAADLRLDVRSDEEGEYFLVATRNGATVEVLNVEPAGAGSRGR